MENLDNLIPLIDVDEDILDIQSSQEIGNVITDDENTDDKNTDDEPITEDNRLATMFYQELIKEQVVEPLEDKEEYSWDDVSTAINSYKTDLPNTIRQEIVEVLPEEVQTLIDYALNKGNLTKEDFRNFYETYLEDLSVADIQTEEQAKSFLRKEYSKNFRPSQVEVMIDALEDENALLEEVKKIQPKAAKVLDSTKQTRLEQEQVQKQFVNNLYEELNNTGWTSSKIRNIKNDLVTGKTNQILNNVRSSPKAVVQLANFASFYNTEKGEFDFDSFIKKSKSGEVKDLKDKINEDLFNAALTSKAATNSSSKKIDFDQLIPINN